MRSSNRGIGRPTRGPLPGRPILTHPVSDVHNYGAPTKFSCYVRKTMTDREKRRAVLLGLLGGGVLATKTLPGEWIKPVVEQIVLPAHAALTGEEKCPPDLDDDCCEDDGCDDVRDDSS
jgi:hypothetical protein